MTDQITTQKDLLPLEDKEVVRIYFEDWRVEYAYFSDCVTLYLDGEVILTTTLTAFKTLAHGLQGFSSLLPRGLLDDRRSSPSSQRPSMKHENPPLLIGG